MLRISRKILEKEETISRLYPKVMKELDSRKKLYERFRRKLTDEELASLSDEEIKVPLERYISVMSAGYFGGLPPIYKLRAYNKDKEKIINELFDYPTNSEEEIKEIELLIEHVVDYNDDSSLFLDLVLDFLVKRACYELHYKDKNTGEITIVRSDALETVAIWDTTAKKDLIGIYRVINTQLANGEYAQMIELITTKGKKYYYTTKEKIQMFETPDYDIKYKDEPLFKENEEEAESPKWNDIPAVAYEQADGLSIFELLISLIKAYQRSIQNSRNTFKYNDEAILAIKGYTPENPMTIVDENGKERINPARVQEDEYVLNSRVRYLDENGDIHWVEKNVNDSAVQNHKKTLIDIICLCSFCPNMTDLGFTAADNNSALEKKFFSLQQYIATFEGIFKKGLLRRWKIIIEKINKEKGKTYDYRDINVKLQRNVPSDETSKTTNALKLRGLLSDDSVINMLPFDLDSKSEISKMKNQNEENIEENLRNMQKMGQNTENTTLNIEQNNPNKKFEQDDEVKKQNIKQSDAVTKK